MVAAFLFDRLAGLLPGEARLRVAPAVPGVLAALLLSLSGAVWAGEVPDGESLKEKLDQQRRELAEKELQRAREQQRQLERTIEARRWALRQFELHERGMIPRPQRVLRHLERMQARRNALKFSLLQYRDKARGAVARGTALNFFLEECGATAFDHVVYRELALPEHEGDDDRQVERELLGAIAAHYVLTDDVTRHVRYTRGLVGPKLTGRLNAEPLDLNWPAALRDAKFERSRERIEELRDRVLAELHEGRPVSASTADQLLDEVQGLRQAVRREMQGHLGRFRQGRADAQREWHRFAAAERHVKLLVMGTCRLVEAQQAEDVTFGEFREGTVEELLAFMYRNNLQFAEADANGEPAYHMLYEMIARYYLDLYALRVALAADEQELRGAKSLEDELLQTALGNTMTAAQKFELGMQAMQTIIAGMEAYSANQKRKTAEALR